MRYVRGIATAVAVAVAAAVDEEAAPAAAAVVWAAPQLHGPDADSADCVAVPTEAEYAGPRAHSSERSTATALGTSLMERTQRRVQDTEPKLSESRPLMKEASCGQGGESGGECDR